MTAKTFVDSNILLYVYDRGAGWKQAACKQIVQDIWLDRCGVISTQVMQEFYNNVTRKIPSSLTFEQARTELKLYESWEVIQITPALIQTASLVQETHQLSFWDSLIVAAAQIAKAEVLLTEDLNHGQRIGGVRIHNPLINQVHEESAGYGTN